MGMNKIFRLKNIYTKYIIQQNKKAQSSGKTRKLCFTFKYYFDASITALATLSATPGAKAAGII